MTGRPECLRAYIQITGMLISAHDDCCQGKARHCRPRQSHKDSSRSRTDIRAKEAQDGIHVHAERERKEAGADVCKRKEQTGQAQAACVHHEKTGLQHPEDMQGTGHAVFHRARLAGADAGAGIEGQVQQGAAWQEKQAAQIIPQDGSVVAQEQAKKVRVRVRLLAAQLCWR